MIKYSSSIFPGWQGAILVLVALVTALIEPAYCQTDGIALLLQQTPAGGGTIAPEVGLHHFGLNANVTLTATAKPGYQFVCWIGDVSETAASKTITYIDAPKIIVAVFERSEYDFQITEEPVSNTSGIGGVRASPEDYARGGGGGGGGRRGLKESKPPKQPPSEFPVPKEKAAFPVPEVPEPATIMLLGTGAAFLLRRRPKSK